MVGSGRGVLPGKMVTHSPSPPCKCGKGKTTKKIKKMYTLEFPSIGVSYQILCVRDAYTIGRLESGDIVLKDQRTVSRQHATLQVMHRDNYFQQVVSSDKMDDQTNRLLRDSTIPLVVLVVRNFCKFGTLVNDCPVVGSTLAPSGSTIQLSPQVIATVRYRPVFVSIALSQYRPEYAQEVTTLLAAVGATIISSPKVVLEYSSRGDAVACFHVADEIDDSAGVLEALALGHWLVQPMFVFEFFAAVSESPSRPLHELPHPEASEPGRKRSVYQGVSYVQPKPRSIPYTMFPISSGNRSRENLFSGRAFYFWDTNSKTKLAHVVPLCGGIVVPSTVSGDVPAAVPKHACYLVVSAATEAAVTTDVSSPEVTSQLRAAGGAGGCWVLLAERSVCSALVSNQLVPATIKLPNDHADEVAAEVMEEDVVPGTRRLSPRLRRYQDEALELATMNKTSRIAERGGRWTDDAPRRLDPPITEEAGGGAIMNQPVSASRNHPQFRTLLHPSNNPHRKELLEEDDAHSSGDATPSELCSEDMLQTDPTNTSFWSKHLVQQQGSMLQFEKIQHLLERYLLPELPRLEEVQRTVHRAKFLSEMNLVFLDRILTYSKTAAMRMEELSQLNDGPKAHAKSLMRWWDQCAEVQHIVEECLKVASRLSTKPQLSGSAGSPHRLPATLQSARQTPTAAQLSPSVGSPLQQQKHLIPDGTRLIRYPNLPTTYHSGRRSMPPKVLSAKDELNSKLASAVDASDGRGVARKRLLFLKKHGDVEGEKRFATWLGSQSVVWNLEFCRGLEAKKITLTQLLTLEKSV